MVQHEYDSTDQKSELMELHDLTDNKSELNELTPVWVDDEECDEDGVGHGRRPDEGHDERGNLRSRHHLQQGKKIELMTYW